MLIEEEPRLPSELRPDRADESLKLRMESERLESEPRYEESPRLDWLRWKDSLRCEEGPLWKDWLRWEG